MTRKQIHLAAHFPGVNNTTVWTDPRSGSQIDFASFAHLARTAERGQVRLLLPGRGAAAARAPGRIHDLDVVGRPDSLTVLRALAAVTEHLGLAGTVNTTFNEPYELARQFATLDHLSDGRAAWNVVTSLRRLHRRELPPRRLPRPRRPLRPRRRVRPRSRASCGTPGPTTRVVADADAGVVRRPATPSGRSDHDGAHFAVAGSSTLPRGPQGHPVHHPGRRLRRGREFARRERRRDLQPPRDAGGRAGLLRRRQRPPGSLRPRARRAEDPAGGHVRARRHRGGGRRERGRTSAASRSSPQTAIAFIEQVWGRDLSAYDPDGPLPDVEPDPTAATSRRGGCRSSDPLAVAAKWRAAGRGEEAEHPRAGHRGDRRGRRSSGRRRTSPTQIDEHVQADAADGFILVPHLTPGGLDEFVDRVVPLLQERGVFRTDYTGTTLREHLELS